MSVSSIYLEGFLAAARPGDHAVPPAPPAPVAEVGTEPVVPPAGLSFEEETKRRLHPLDSFARLLDGASANRPPDAEDAFRFQWFGLFYQAPEQDAFILRLRLPGGRLKPFQLAGLAEVTQRYASGQVVLNAQGGLDIAGVPLTAAARVLHEVESIGLSARRTGGDCVQAIRGGEDEDDGPTGNPAAIYPLVCALEQALAQSPVFSDLPLPCQIVFQTDDAPATVPRLGWRHTDPTGGERKSGPE